MVKKQKINQGKARWWENFKEWTSEKNVLRRCHLSKA